jgi:hypothetical protein
VDTRILLLYYLSSFAGLVMVVGGIWLIYKEKIYIDHETKQVIKIKTPVGEFQTNIPALALFVLGFIPLIYPIIKSSTVMEVKKVKLLGSVRATVHPVLVYAALVSESLQQDREFHLYLPVVENSNTEYKIIYIAGNVISEDAADLDHAKNGEIHLDDKEIGPAAVTELVPDVKLTKIPDEFQQGSQ